VLSETAACAFFGWIKAGGIFNVRLMCCRRSCSPHLADHRHTRRRWPAPDPVQQKISRGCGVLHFLLACSAGSILGVLLS
jgi:hypothetical protein